MEPRIQYAKTSDGVNIAYAVFGEGPPLVYIASLIAGVHLYSQFSPARRIVDQLVASGWMVIRYDGRGSGSSDRDAMDCSLDAQLLDLEAVVDRTGLGRFGLIAHSQGTRVAIAYAARRPERVSKLVLIDPLTRGVEVQGASQLALKAMRPLAEEHWELFTLNVAHLAFGFADGEVAKEMAAALRSGTTAAAYVAREEAMERIDVTDLLKSVSAPMVIHYTGIGTSSLQREEVGGRAKRVALGIPDARLVTTSDFAAALDEFLREDREAPGTEPPTAVATGALQTILFTAVEGSTALTDRMGDAAALDVMREHERITREALKAHGGSEVKTMGDGFMAAFGSATKALECAVAIQRAFAEPRRGTAALPTSASGRAEQTPGISVRIGLNAGEPIAEDDPGGRSDLFGTAVIVSARIAAQTKGGEILVSDVVRQLVAGKGFLFNDRGDHALKGFEDPVRVFEVRWREGDS